MPYSLQGFGQVWDRFGKVWAGLALVFHTGLGQVWEGLRAEGRRNCWFSQRFGQVEDRFGQVSRPLGKVLFRSGRGLMDRAGRPRAGSRWVWDRFGAGCAGFLKTMVGPEPV